MLDEMYDDMSDEDSSDIEALEDFYHRGLIEDTPLVIKSGKEATVYRCHGTASSGVRFFAAKVYRPRQAGSFRNDAAYRDGRAILSTRVRRAVAKKTELGRSYLMSAWIDHEYETLRTLRKAGADVPNAMARSPSAILMDYLGDEDRPAAPLHQVRLEPRQARALFERLLYNVQLMLGANRIHADLSPYNILYWNDRLTIIDFPQSVDPRFNPNAWEFLVRDLENLLRYFRRFGVRADANDLASDLWNQFLYAQL